MVRSLMPVLLGALVLVAAPALAAPTFAATMHLRGTVASFTGGVLTLQDGGSTTQVTVPGSVRITGMAPAKLTDIGAGSYIGAAALPEAGGHLRALEVHIFPPSLKGAGEGHHPMPGTQPQQSMTNGTVGTVAHASGTQLTVSYKGGEQVLDVPPGTPIVRLDPGTDALLKPGAAVSLEASESSSGLTALRVRVGEDGAVPPL